MTQLGVKIRVKAPQVIPLKFFYKRNVTVDRTKIKAHLSITRSYCAISSVFPAQEHDSNPKLADC